MIPAGSPTENRLRPWLIHVGPAVVLGVLGTAFLLNVAPYWQVNPQYSYGWLVPCLCVFTFARRWPCRPAPAPAGSLAFKILLGVVALAFLPIWLIVQPNPDWRLATWALALELVATALCTLYFLGGTAWLRHFAFPVLFLLTAVPWPFDFEFMLVQNLMRGVATVTVELLTTFGIAAIQHGNLIEVRVGTLGVDEACSGIRSLQATLMASLFLGEFYWFRARQRILLILVGMVLAFVCNVGRATLISAVAARDGLDAVSHWHDPAGYTILTVCLLGLWAAACLLSPQPAPLAPHGAGYQGHSLPQSLFAVAAVWLLVSMAATEAWYRLHEGRETVRWSLRWPETRKSFTELPIPQNTRDMLLYDQGRSASWEEPDGTTWNAFFFRWNAGTSRSRVMPRSHRPEICLTASGFTLEKDDGIRTFRVQGLDLPIHSYRFSLNGQAVWVYTCVWQDRPKEELSTPTDLQWSRWAGLGFVRRGERNLSQQVLEIGIFGQSSADLAESALQAELEQMIVR